MGGGGGGVGHFGSKNKGGFQNLQDLGGPFGLWGVKFSRGGLDFEEGKALFWHWIISIFNFFYLQRAILP